MVLDLPVKELRESTTSNKDKQKVWGTSLILRKECQMLEFL
jgi:hypothetical protein